MSAGTVDVRRRESTGKSRMRFFGVADDELEIILVALEIARNEANTIYDSVALDHICSSYLTERLGKKA